MEMSETGRSVTEVMEFPAIDGALSCTPPTVPTWLRKRLSERKAPHSTLEEIESKLRDADLRRQKFYENISSKARPRPPSPSRSSSHEDNPAQRLKAKLLAAEEKRLSILTNSQMRLAKRNELRQAAKTDAEMRFKRQRAELGTKVEMRVRQAEANRLLILGALRQRRATLKDRASQSSMRRVARESKYKERVRDAISQKRAAAEKKRFGLLEAEKKRARALALQVQRVANSNQRKIVKCKIKEKLEGRLTRERTKRAEFSMSPYNTVHCKGNTMHEQADTLSRKLARCWKKFKKLKKTTAHLAKVYNKLNINERSVKSIPFEQFALLLQSSSTLRIVKPLLDRLEIRFRMSGAIGFAPNPSSYDDIDHLLKRVAIPTRKNFSRKAISSREGKKIVSVREAAETPVQLSRYQARIVLCAYMILGHPDAVISGQGERQMALAKSAGKFVQEFELLIKIILNGPLDVPNDKSDHELVTRQTFKLQLAAFDSAWCSFLNSFVVWKTKDAKSLEEDLIRAACRLELSMIQTCKMTPEGVTSPSPYHMMPIQKHVSNDQKLLREKVLHLSGEAGIQRMENAISETRMKFFNARENGSSLTPSTELVSPTPASPSPSPSSGISDKVSTKSSMMQPLFRDEISKKETSTSPSSNSTSQSSGESFDMKNVMIVNEYVHGEHLAFTDNPSTSGVYRNNMEKLKGTMEKAFWDSIVESVKQDEPNYSHVVELMREARDEICAMAPQSWREEIFEVIDLEILMQVLSSGGLDIDYLGKILESALTTLQKLSAPAYENELKKKHQQFMKELAETCFASGISKYSHVVALISGLRFVLQQIQELKQEISKARIRMLEPFLKGPEALYYLGKFFTNHYGHPSKACNALPLTEKWLSSARIGKEEEWNEHKNSLSELTRHESSLNFLPSTTLRTGGSLLVKMNGNQTDASSTSSSTNYIETIDPTLEYKGEEVDFLVRLGLLKLVNKITGLTENELPETLSLNLARLRNVQSRIQKIIVIATSLLVLRQTLLSQHIISSQSQMDSILSRGFKRLSDCLDSVADAGVKDIIEILTTATEEEEKSIDTKKLEPMKEIMARMLTKSLQDEDAVFTRVSRAVYVASRGVMLGENGKRGRELAEMALQKVGAALLVDEVVQAASVLVVMAKVSVIVHGPWYANLIIIKE